MDNEQYKIDKVALVEEKTQRAAEAVAVIEKNSEGAPVAFLKANYGNKKIRERKNDIDFRAMLSAALTKICALAGITKQISVFDGEDIVKMILSAYNDLTLEEIYKSFELERYGAYEAKTDHFQLFNAEYVSSVLKKYQKWKQDTKIQHNISPPQQVEEVTDSAKKDILKKGIVRVFDEFKETGIMPEPNNYIFDELYELKIIPDGNTPELQSYYQRKYEQASKEVKQELNMQQQTFDTAQRRAISEELQKIINGNSDKVVARTKKIILTEYFQKLIRLGKHISEVINK